MTTKITSANIDATVATTTSLNTATAPVDTNAFNISLLGFKMAVNEGLTVFNLVDGVVDEFNDESGTDEAEGSNDLYCGTSDYYINSTTPQGVSVSGNSAGFTTTSITEPDTSTAGTNPSYGSGSFGTYTVPSCISSVNIYTFGAGGASYNRTSGGGGFAKGTLAVTPGQSLRVAVGEGGFASPLPGNSAPTSGQSYQTRSLGGGGASISEDAYGVGTGGGLSGVFNSCVPTSTGPNTTVSGTAPQAIVVAGGGGVAGYSGNGGGGGGLIGFVSIYPATFVAQTNAANTSSGTNEYAGGGGSQTQGGQAAGGQNGGLFFGGTGNANSHSSTAGGSGFYGGGSSTVGGPFSNGHGAAGGGGSSYYGHPQITCGVTFSAVICGSEMQRGAVESPTNGPTILGYDGVPTAIPSFPTVGDGGLSSKVPGQDGYVLITTANICASATSTTIVSTAFSSTSVPTNSRIVVFEENVDTPTLNTDIIASVSRDGGATFTNATLSDSGYVTGSSGQRILTGQADISGQPSGQSMRWKLALANNTVKIHGVSLQWS